MFSAESEKVKFGAANYRWKRPAGGIINKLFKKYKMEGVTITPYTFEDYQREVIEGTSLPPATSVIRSSISCNTSPGSKSSPATRWEAYCFPHSNCARMMGMIVIPSGVREYSTEKNGLRSKSVATHVRCLAHRP